MKKSMGANTLLFPLPAVVVSTYDDDNKPNMMTASWTGIINSNPTMLSVSMRKATYSHDLMLKRKAFTVSIPSRKDLLAMDYVGTKSGKNENKFETTGLTALKSKLVDAPYINEFPLVLECKLVSQEELGLHTMFMGEIIDVKIDEKCFKENGQPDMEKIDPIAYAHGDREYYALGEYLGRANRLWQPTFLNDKWSEEELKIVSFVNDFYKSLDGGEDISHFINWHNFKMVNGDVKIDSKDKFMKWYENVQNEVFNRKHILESLKIEALENNKWSIIMDMHFSGLTWKQGEARTSKVASRSFIKWILASSDNNHDIKLEDYIIQMK